MKIFIDIVDSTKPEGIGNTKMPSYPVHFKSAGFEGWARFVPYGENPEDYLNQELEVEVDYESISNIFSCKNQQSKVEPLTERFAYQVLGEVKALIHHSEPPGNGTVYVSAGDADFAVGFGSLGNLSPSEGEMVKFDIHGLSLWDEMI